jgi:hypothetical protein
MSGNLKFTTLAVLLLVALPMSPATAKSDQTYAVLHASEPAIPAGWGRIYFYREGGFAGSAVQPTIYINGESSGGRSKPGDYYYLDVPAGTYEISTETEKKEAISLNVAPAAAMYIRIDITMGFFIGHGQPSIIDPQQAVKEIADCDFYTVKSIPSFATPPAAAVPTAAAAPAAPDATAPAAPEQPASPQPAQPDAAAAPK